MRGLRLAAALLAGLLFVPPLAARAEAPSSDVRWGAGASLGVFFRDEAGGNRTALPEFVPRVALFLTPHLLASASYAFAYSPSGSVVAGAGTQHHRAVLKAEYLLPVRKAAFVVSAGPALVWMHTTLYDRGRAMAGTDVVRLGGEGGVALEVPLGRLVLRTGTDALLAGGRLDLSVRLGAGWAFGGGR